MKNVASLLTIIGVFFLIGWANAATFASNWNAIEYDAGFGADQALLIIDFGNTSSADSYIFGFNFTDDDTVTGYDMVATVGTLWDGTITMAPDVLYYEETVYSWGVFIDNFYYNGETTQSGTWWQYYLSETDTSGDFQGWTSSGVGAAGRTLANQSWDGWYNPGFTGEDTPSTVPVPAAIWLLGSGLLAIVGIGRRR